MKNLFTLIFLFANLALLTAAPPPEPVTPVPLMGAVLETMESGGYTYLLVEHTGGKIWVAGKPVKLAVGDKVRIADGMLMKGFESRTLKRKFDWILFASAVEVNGQSGAAPAPALPPGHPPLTNALPAVAAHPVPTASIEVKPGAIAKVPGGYTVAECYAQQKKLAGKSIKVRGVVVKFSADIMGKNWAHLRDGTGAAGSNDLTVTTADTVKPGDAVVAEGKLSTNRDFGAGYKYAILLEDATLGDRSDPSNKAK
jgi:hypothetical protein